MLFISPPFGNYISTKNTTSIKGSFTLEPRDGLILQILKTLRYSFENKGWINKIGLRNPGIDYAIREWKENNDNNNNINNNNDYTKKIIYSIAILDEKEIPVLVKKIPKHMNLEINASCPNLSHDMVVTGIYQFLNPDREWCIVKLSPQINKKHIDNFYQQGFRQFHCSNTLKTPRGGLSGDSLKPYTSELVTYIKNKYPDTTVIAGGGIKKRSDIEMYEKCGADHFSVSTLWFHPFQAFQFWIKEINK